MSSAPAADSKRTAVALSARVDRLLDRPQRTRAEDEEMLHAVHASRHFLGQTGQRKDVIRAEWLCSRVYAALGRAEPALHHARRCLELCSGVELEPHDLARAYEALARATAVARDPERSRRFEMRAREIGSRIFDDDERDRLLVDLSAIARGRALASR